MGVVVIKIDNESQVHCNDVRLFSWFLSRNPGQYFICSCETFYNKGLISIPADRNSICYC